MDRQKMVIKQNKKVLKQNYQGNANNRSKIVIVVAVFFVVVLAGSLSWRFREELAVLSTTLVSNEYELVSEERMDIMKRNGCVYDGLLTPRYNTQFNASVEMLKRSECRYIHRAVETWNIPPDFGEIRRRIDVITKKTKKKFIFSLFFAESIDITKGYYDPIRKKHFNFSKMCSPGTMDAWGENTCKPSIAKMEYRQYVDSVIRRAIDLGIEDFIFGQVYYQDPNWKNSNALMRGIIFRAKKYAALKGREISIGGQTNTMDDEKYLRSFDYITGGIGQDKNGNIEEGHPCWSYYFKRDGYCWALMWDKKYKNKANNVLVYLDWNNSSADDIHRFVRMGRDSRRSFIGKAYDFLLWRDVGFLAPLGVVLGDVGGGCFGATREFYSASNKYSCKDENAVNNVFLGKKPLLNRAKFISINVPSEMVSGKSYPVRVRMQNNSFRIWTNNDKFKLGSVAPQDNMIWGINRVELDSIEMIGHKNQKDFAFDIVAPNEKGKYVFQWKMLEEGGGWFGDESEKVIVDVIENNTINDLKGDINTVSNVDIDKNSMTKNNIEDSLSTTLIEGLKNSDNGAEDSSLGEKDSEGNVVQKIKNLFKRLRGRQIIP